MFSLAKKNRQPRESLGADHVPTESNALNKRRNLTGTYAIRDELAYEFFCHSRRMTAFIF